MDRPSSTSSSKWSWPFGALFACLLLCLGELGTRAFFKPPYVSLETYTAYYPFAPLYGFEGSRACFRVREQMSCAPTQDMNIIPATFPLAKPRGELRIVVIGASISWEGAGASSSVDNYPSRMLAQLEQAHPGRSVRLINLSVPGFGSTRQVVRFREALEYDADLFIIHTHDTNEVREDQRRAYVNTLHSGLAGKLLYLNSIVVLKRWWSNQLGLRSKAPAVAEGDEAAGLDASAKLQRWEGLLQHNTQTMLDLARAHAIPVILIGASRSDTPELRGARGRVLNASLETRVGPRVQFLDVPALFLAQTDRKHRRLFKDKIHYSAEGTRVVAAALTPLVENALPALSPAPSAP